MEKKAQVRNAISLQERDQLDWVQKFAEERNKRIQGATNCRDELQELKTELNQKNAIRYAYSRVQPAEELLREKLRNTTNEMLKSRKAKESQYIEMQDQQFRLHKHDEELQETIIRLNDEIQIHISKTNG